MDKNLTDFLRELGEKTSTPGGGTVAGLNGAIASAQLKMVCEFTKNKDVNALSTKLTKKVDQFMNLAELDGKAYQDVKEAYKTKEDEKIQKALLLATDPSVKMLEYSNELVDLSSKNLAEFNKNLLSDLVVSLANVKAAVRSAQAMIAVNAKSITSKDIKNSLKSQIIFATQILNKADSMYQKIWSLSKDV